MTIDYDLAKAVRDKAKERLDKGELKPNMRDGLQAQALLDRREEKQRDRNFMLSLARLTSGATHEVPESIVIEGETAKVVTALSGEGSSEDEAPPDEPVQQ